VCHEVAGGAPRCRTASLTLSTWGLSEKEFFEVTSDWLGWWQDLVESGKAVV